MKTRVLMVGASALILTGVGAGSAVAAGFDSGSKSCSSGFSVVNRGDSGSGSQGHTQKTSGGLLRGKQFPYKGYRHVDYSNWGFTSVSLWSVQIDPGTLYYETTYAYCVD